MTEGNEGKIGDFLETRRRAVAQIERLTAANALIDQKLGWLLTVGYAGAVRFRNGRVESMEVQPVVSNRHPAWAGYHFVEVGGKVLCLYVSEETTRDYGSVCRTLDPSGGAWLWSAFRTPEEAQAFCDKVQARERIIDGVWDRLNDICREHDLRCPFGHHEFDVDRAKFVRQEDPKIGVTLFISRDMCTCDLSCLLHQDLTGLSDRELCIIAVDKVFRRKRRSDTEMVPVFFLAAPGCSIAISAHDRPGTEALTMTITFGRELSEPILTFTNQSYVCRKGWEEILADKAT